MIEIQASGRVRRITLNRPKKRNALNSPMCRDLAQAFEEADRDESVGAILLTANGPVFCAGMDLEDALTAEPAQLGRLHEVVFTQINRVHKPIIAAVEGAALGGGTGLVANAHIVIASPEARFGLTEIRIGLWPILIMNAVILAIGERRATELSLTGRIFDAAEALDYGLITELAATPGERAAAIAEDVSRHSPTVMAEGLIYTRALRGVGWLDAAEMGRDVRDRLMSSPDFQTRAREFLRGRGLRRKLL